ncbi:MAG TPA: hypothetical protein PKO06_07230, partial [Candidatus Ozemobacteraceae bacterium]|nr:hypothetical protein [Candidatus Ozemobacteraceae bacterium]
MMMLTPEAGNRIFRRSGMLELLLAFLAVVAMPATGLELQQPKLAVTSLECKVSPRDLPSDAVERPFQWFVDGALATEGRAVPTALAPLTHTFSTSGRH